MAAPLAVAIVGSGIGAASTTYYLKELLGPRVNISVFEKESHLSGRTLSHVIDGRTVELGASIVYTGNLYARELIKVAGLTEKDGGGADKGSIMGIYNGKNFVFTESYFSVVTLFTMMFRYGYDLIRLRNSVKDTLTQFDQIYKLQANGTCFDTPAALWGALGLYNLTQESFSDYSKTHLSPNSLLAQELICGVNRVNYNQNNGLNALAGLVSLCPLITGTLVSTNEGFQEISRRILPKHAEAIYTNTQVTRIEHIRNKDGNMYRLHSGERILGEYNAVVVAAPLESSEIKVHIEGNDVLDIPRREYRTVFTTFLRGKVNPAYFGLGKNGKTPEAVLVTESALTPFNSIAKYWGSDSDAVFKLFSVSPMSNDDLTEIFEKHEIITTKKWAAYPLFDPPERLASFVLKEGHPVYYLSAIEGAVSAMEISCIGGKNVAMLLQRDANAPAQECAQQDQP